jgi:hydrogenase maturation protease
MVYVICLGSEWHGDDGFGIHLFRKLSGAGRLPAGVRLVEAGTAGLDALASVGDCTKVVLVDAMRTGGPTGTVRRLLPEDVAPPDPEFSIHELGVSYLLAALPVVFQGRAMPQVVLIGAEIADASPFTDRLSYPLQCALEVAAESVLRECTGQP